MRIGGGRLRGRKLYTPRGLSTRPTSGRLKKSLFDVLAPSIVEARVLDLFAGAGALGIEALSRGAARAVLVERGRRAREAIERNLDELELAAVSEIVSRDALEALSWLSERGRRFELVLADPPYRSGQAAKLLTLLGELPLVVEGGLVAVEHHHKTELSDVYGRLRRRRRLRAGESTISLFGIEPGHDDPALGDMLG